jgi:Ca2+-binding RTX toxin-like protein
VVLLFGSEISVSQQQPGIQASPVITALAGGGFIAVWSGSNAANPNVMARIYGADGTATGAEFRVNENPIGLNTAPAVTTLADGSVAVAWICTQNGAAEVKGRILSDQGLPVGQDFVASGGTGGVQGAIGLSPLSGGGFAAVWSAGPEGAGLVQMRQFDGDGLPSGPQSTCATLAATSQSDPVIAAFADGGLVVAWGNKTVGRDVQMRLFSPEAAPLGTEFAGHDIIDDTQITPSLAVLSDGSFVLVWQGTLDGKGSIQARHFDQSGQALGVEFAVAPSKDGQRLPDVTALANGGFVITWEEIVGGDYGDVFLRQFDSSGLPLFLPQTVHIPDDANQSKPEITCLSDGRIVVVWSDAGDIVARIIDTRVQLVSGGNDLISGTDTAPWMMAAGDALTVAATAELKVLNQHAIQSGDQSGSGMTLMIRGRVETLASNESFDAVHLIGAGGHQITISDSGVVRSASGTGILLMNGANTVLNQGVIQGATLAMQGGAGEDNLINTGQIVGNVDLGAGNDILDGRGGQISGWIAGGIGDDEYLISSSQVQIVELWDGGQDVLRSSVSVTLADNLETLILTGDAGLRGGGNTLANVIVGSNGNDRLAGIGGNDRIVGSAGNDRLVGGDGADSLSGGGGDDRLFGGDGRDTLTGGKGADVFVFAPGSTAGRAPDQIGDFRPGQDRIDLSGLTGEKLTFIGTDEFDDGLAQVRLAPAGRDTLVQIDLNGDGRADMAILCVGVRGLDAADFLL